MPFLNKIGKCDNLRCGLIHMVHDLPVPVPLKNVHLEVKIVDFVSQVTITQEYVNHEANPIEVLYSYPVEESAAIIAFEAVVDGHEIEAEVKKKDEAKADYNKAMLEGNTAILLEETAPDIFSMKLGQLKPGAGAKVKLMYIMELPVEDKSIRLTIPTTIAPRYIPPTDDSDAAEEIAKLIYNTNNTKGQIPLYVNIESTMKGKIKKISSPSHSLKTEIKELADENGQYQAKSGLEDATTDVMDRDLVVLIQTEENDKPVVFIEKTPESLASLVSLIPSFKLDEQKVELIFLVDRSGSMGGESMEQAKKALELFLHSIPANCYFNIWSFGSQFSCLFDGGSKIYDDTSLDEAKNHTNQMSANFGGTEVYKPLQAIFNEKSITGYAKQIFLLTDGAVSNNQSVIKLVKDNCKNARVFTLGLGSSASRNLVKGVARAGNGTSIFASLNEDLRPKVMTLLKNSLMPSLTNVEILWNQKKEEPNVAANKVRTLLGFNKPDPKTKAKVASTPGVLFDGSRMLSFKIFDQDELLENVTVTAQAADGPLSVTIPIGNDCLLKSGKLVHQMAARRQIQDLEEENSEYVPDEVKDKISDIALKYGIASKSTSFVGVDKKTRKSVLEPAMTTRQIQQEVPRGFGFGGRAFKACYAMPQMAACAMPMASQRLNSVGSVNRSQSAKLKCKSSAPSPLRSSLFGGATGGQQQNTTSLFGSSSSTSVFGSSNTYGQTVFGGGQSSNSLFGSPAVSTSNAPSAFGGQTSSLVFGGQQTNAQNAGSLFGATTTSAPPASRSLFEGRPQQSTEPYDVAKMDAAPKLHMNSNSSDFSELSDFEDLPSGKGQKGPVSKEDTLTKLIHLQTANGSFKFGQILQELAGMTEDQLMEKVQESEADGIWITALALALLEKKFSEDKELWELIANKAKTFIQIHTKSNFDEIMKKVATILI